MSPSDGFDAARVVERCLQGIWEESWTPKQVSTTHLHRRFQRDLRLRDSPDQTMRSVGSVPRLLCKPTPFPFGFEAILLALALVQRQESSNVTS